MDGRNTIVTGYHAIEERLTTAEARGVLFVARRSARIDRIVALARRRKVAVVEEPPARLDERCGHADHRGLVLELAAMEASPHSLESILAGLTEQDAIALVLDGITDPHNLGAVLRSADQFGVDVCVVPSRRSAKDNETVARSSAGADAYVQLVVVANIARALELLKKSGFWVYGADADGAPAHLQKLTGRVAIVLGSEGRGLHRLVAEHCDGLMSVPTRGHVDSLNVSVAAGILMYEARRQQERLDGRAPQYPARTAQEPRDEADTGRPSKGSRRR